MSSVRVAVDVGGTFTDVCIFDDETQQMRVTKVPSTPGDPMIAVMNGVERGEIDLGDVALFSHGTTVATNALITRNFPAAALVTTRGLLGIADFAEAREQRTRVYDGMVGLFERIDVLAAPVTTVLPFPAEQHWPSEINGVAQADYLDWMRASWRISVTGFAAISVPCGFSPEGLPVGLQLIAPPRSEALLLSLARQFERELPVWRSAPMMLSR